MEFDVLRRHWDRLGRRDPLWAVLTHPDKRDGGWQIDQFFASGVAEIESVLARAVTRGVKVPRRSALDFGCGVGRLTQAMAAHFDRADGVDISTAMVRQARDYNRHADRCQYHVNAREDLRLFAEGTFTFIYSAIVLQHMAPKYATGYIAEFVRLLAADGLLVFQVPSHRVGVSARDGAVASSGAGPLPPAACRARISTPLSGPVNLRGTERMSVRVTVENRSEIVWPARATNDGRFQIAVANRWLTSDGALVQRDDFRAWLPHDVGPGESIEVVLDVTAPAHDGAYILSIDLVQEDVCWFAERGSEALQMQCRITGGQAGPPPIVEPPPMPPQPVASPFRERHPGLFRVLKATRLRDLYWAGRRGLDRVKAGRDDFIRARVHPRANALRRAWDWRVRKPDVAVMEMHCLPRAEVTATVERAGALIIDVEETLEAGGFYSCRYWITKTSRS